MNKKQSDTSKYLKIKHLHLINHVVFDNEFYTVLKADDYMMELVEDLIMVAHKTSLHKFIVPLTNVRNLELV